MIRPTAKKRINIRDPDVRLVLDQYKEDITTLRIEANNEDSGNLEVLSLFFYLFCLLGALLISKGLIFIPLYVCCRLSVASVSFSYYMELG